MTSRSSFHNIAAARFTGTTQSPANAGDIRPSGSYHAAQKLPWHSRIPQVESPSLNPPAPSLRRSLYAFLTRVLTVLLGLTFAVPLGICANETEPDDSPYTTFWTQIGQLLSDREYGSAADLIADAETDPELAAYKQPLDPSGEKMRGH